MTIRLYDAESKTAWSAKAATTLDQREAQRLAMQAVAWLRSKGYVVAHDPQVTMSRGSGSRAWRGTGAIHFGKERPLRWILLHEVAHLVSPSKRHLPGWDGDEDRRSHGRAFMVVYLLLIGHYCGTADKAALMAECRKLGVKYRPRRRLQLTDEERAERADRLARHRPAPSPHRFAFRRTVTARQGEVTVYVSSRRSDTAQWTDPDGNGFSATLGTVHPERAVTRTTREGLARWAEQNLWWLGHLDDYEVADIADVVIPLERAAAARQERLRQIARNPYAAHSE